MAVTVRNGATSIQHWLWAGAEHFRYSRRRCITMPFTCTKILRIQITFCWKSSPARGVKDGKHYINVTEWESMPFDRRIGDIGAGTGAGGSYFQHERAFIAIRTAR